MRLVRAWFRRAVGMFRGDARERDFADEIESHLQLHIDENIRAGMTPESARRAAVLKFGPLEVIKEQVRQRGGVPIAEIILRDLRFAVRRLIREPGYSLVIVLTLALGVGANAAMFGIVDALMFRMPDHVHEPERLVSVLRVNNYVQFRELRKGLRLADVAAYTRPRTLSYGAGADARPLRTQCVTSGLFQVTGTTVPVGRGFTDADDRLGAERSILLSHGFWSRQFGGDANALGRTVLVSGRSYTVIGVAPRGFRGIELEPVDAWITIAATPEACSFTGTNLLRSEGSWLTTIGRLREAVTLPRAMTELSALEAGREPLRLSSGRVIETAARFELLYPPRRSLTADGRLALWLAGAAGVLLLLACANIAGLQSMRAVDRRREIAVRLQLGASGVRVFGQLLMEHLVLASLGGVVAIVVAVWLASAFGAFFPFVPGGLLDQRVLAILAVLALGAGILSGSVPALQAIRSTAGAHLRTGRATTAARSRFRTMLLVTQVALALVLVVGAGLFARSVQAFRNDFKYDLEHVVTAAIDFRRTPGMLPEQIRAVFELLLHRVRELPQVEQAALTTGSILGTGGGGRVVFIRRTTNDTSPAGHLVREVTPDFFGTLGLRLTGGRDFSDADRSSGRRTIILNQALATRLFPGEDPIGQCLLLASDPCTEVIGVTEVFRATIDSDSQADSHVFLPLGTAANYDGVPAVLLIRTRGRADGEVTAIAAALQGAAPDLPYVNVRPLEALADTQARPWRLGAMVFGLFSTLAVILAGIGIYGSLAFSIRQRTTEIGLRLALGALRRDIARMVLRQGAIVVLAGSLLGAAGAYAGSRFIRGLLFNVAPGDPLAFALAVGVIVIAALAGCAIPAVRAARLDPAVALRHD